MDARYAMRPSSPLPETANLPSPRPRRALPPEPEPVRTVTLRAGVAALAVVLVAALAVVGALVAGRATQQADPPVPHAATPSTWVPTASPTPTEPSQTPTPTQVTPTSAAASGSQPAPAVPPQGGAAQLPEREWEVLPAADPASPFYAAQVTGLDGVAVPLLDGCPPPAVVSSEDEWREAVQAQWTCVHNAWLPVMAANGWDTTQPPVEFYAGEGTDSSCGYFTAPAFYCSTGAGTVFFGHGHYAMASGWELSVNEMVNHEYGHHLQSLSGITAARIAVPGVTDQERRSELQALCWSAAMTVHNSSLEFNQQALQSWNRRLASMVAGGDHGTRESIRYWGTRGLYATTMSECNTWVADEEDI